MLKTVSRDLVMAVRELMERGWTVADIAAKMNIDHDDIQMVVNIINNILS